MLLSIKMRSVCVQNFGWFPSSVLGTLILQAPAWPFFGKLELQKPHSKTGYWERANSPAIPLASPHQAKPTRFLKPSRFGHWQ